MNVNLTGEAEEIVEQRALDQNIAPGEVVRRSVVAFDYIRKHQEQGHRIIIADENGAPLEEVAK